MALPQAAMLAESSYAKSVKHAGLKPRIVATLDANDVQAYMLDDQTLLIPGSDTALDYLKFNLRLMSIGGTRYKVKNSATGEKIGRIWHQGFLAHAMFVQKTFEASPPKFIIGHSLGAASAQILSMVWQVPAICFAAPRVYFGGEGIQNSQKCLCLWRTDDPVGRLPNHRFRHAGKSISLGKSRRRGILNHHMRHYNAAIKDPNHSSVIPSVWPVTG